MRRNRLDPTLGLDKVEAGRKARDAMAATRAMSTALPVTLEACVTTTARVSGVTNRSSSS